MLYLHYLGGVTEAGVRNVHTLIIEAHRAGEKDVTLCLASNGGSVNAGIAFYNFAKMAPLAVNTHAAGLCDSIAATMFLAGVKRTAAPLSRFVLHRATFSDGPNKGKRSPDTDLIAAPFKDVLGWSEADISSRFGVGDFHISPTDAVNFGLAAAILNPVVGPTDRQQNVVVP